jgi:hypothetical protein
LVVGCVLVARRPDNRIGWIFTAVGLLTTAAILAQGYTTYAYVTHPGSLPGRLFAAWVFTWIWLPIGMLTVVFPLLLFPTGRSLSARWRPVTWLAVGLTAAWTVVGALKPSLDVINGTVPNPIGVSGANPNTGLASTVLNSLMLFVMAAAIVSLVVRFRRSRAVERQQFKWFAYAGVLVVLAILSTNVLPSLGNLPWVVVIALPISVGIAILRYRLYDIDRLINRTLVYGLLTAILGLVYAGAVLILGQVFGGGVTEDPPSWAVAGATLAVAALFQPARRRIQAVVDRRFNRHKYDASKTVEAFSARFKRRDRPGHPLGRAAGGGPPDDAANDGDPMAPTLGTGPAAWSRTRKLSQVRQGLTPCMPDRPCQTLDLWQTTLTDEAGKRFGWWA